VNAKKVADKIHDENLRKTPDACCKGPSDNEGRSWGRCHKDFIQDAHVPFPYECNSVKNGDEENALSKDSGRNEIQIGMAAADLYHTCIGHGLTKDKEPDGRLDHSGKEFKGVMTKLADISFHYSQSLTNG